MLPGAVNVRLRVRVWFFGGQSSLGAPAIKLRQTHTFAEELGECQSMLSGIGDSDEGSVAHRYQVRDSLD